MKIVHFFTLLLVVLVFSTSRCMEREGSETVLSVGDIERDLGIEESVPTQMDAFLSNMDPMTARRIRERATEKLRRFEEQAAVVRRRGKAKKEERDPTLVALLESFQEEVALRQQEVDIQRENLDDAKESSKTATRFAWAGLGLGLASFATATVFSVTSLIMSLASSSPVVECVCK
jgi:hypothetical protein